MSGTDKYNLSTASYLEKRLAAYSTTGVQASSHRQEIVQQALKHRSSIESTLRAENNNSSFEILSAIPSIAVHSNIELRKPTCRNGIRRDVELNHIGSNVMFNIVVKGSRQRASQL